MELAHGHCSVTQALVVSIDGLLDTKLNTSLANNTRWVSSMRQHVEPVGYSSSTRKYTWRIIYSKAY